MRSELVPTLRVGGAARRTLHHAIEDRADVLELSNGFGEVHLAQGEHGVPEREDAPPTVAISKLGAWSYFAERGAGNVLVDSPRATGPLLGRLEEL